MFSLRLCLLLLPSACVCLVALNNERATRPSREVREPAPHQGEEISLDATMTAPTTPALDTSLAEALRALRRRKREISGTHRPYSAYQPLSTHRYRYPLYRKRSIYPSEDYFDDEDPYLTNEGIPLSDWDEFEPEKPSLFRERERGPSQKLISNAHFSTKTLYNKREMPNNRQSYPKMMPTYNLDSSPYNLSPINIPYAPDKMVSNSPAKSRNLASRSNKLRAINEVSPLKLDEQPMTEQDEAYANLLKAAIEEYKRYGPLNNAMIRRKRDVSTPLDMSTSAVSNSPSKNETRSGLRNLPTEMGNSQITKAGDRQKRAYKALPVFLDPRDEARRDFLTREYFKTFARSVGNKRKRMAFARFQAPKRNSLDTFLENPQMLKYVRKEIREAEKEVAKDAQNELEEDIGRSQSLSDDIPSQELLRNVIARLDALERMREALYQLERIQEQEVIQKRAQSLVGETEESEKGKRRKSIKSKLRRDGQKEEEEERLKRKEDAIRNFLNGNARDECPVLERIVQNCLAVTEMVTDEDRVFLEPCLRHEICYMCGAGVDVSQHECDALFSAGLESGCSRGLASTLPSNGPPSLSNCLSAAGTTYTLLGDPTRYDDKGTCTYDPCVRELLEER